MKQAGVPVVPGTEEAVYDLEEAKRSRAYWISGYDQSVFRRRRKRHADCKGP